MQVYRRIIPLFEGYCRQDQIDGKEVSASIGDSKLKLKVMSTPDSMNSGYSKFPEPKDGEGLLFVYDREMPLEFWMKKVDFPLDIIFFDSMMNLVNHLTMDPCGDLKDEDLPIYRSEEPARFAVEVKSGWCDRNLSPNSRLKF